MSRLSPRGTRLAFVLLSVCTLAAHAAEPSAADLLARLQALEARVGGAAAHAVVARRSRARAAGRVIAA